MSKTLFLLAAGLAAPILAPQLDAHLLSFRVEDGTSLTTTATRVLTLELSDGEMSMSFDGEEHEAEAPEIELVITEEESLTFSDVFTGVTEGRAAKIKRTFDEIETSSSQHLVNPEGEEMEDETPGTSELTEKTVVFTWDADDESYSCAFDESVEDGDPDLLEELEAIADFSWYLPEGEVEVGDTWEIDVEAFRQTSSLSGELSVVREGDEDDEDTDFGDQFNDNLSGEITGEFLEVREEDGRKLAVLHITSELETSIEQTQEMVRVRARGRPAVGPRRGPRRLLHARRRLLDDAHQRAGVHRPGSRDPDPHLAGLRGHRRVQDLDRLVPRFKSTAWSAP